MKKMLNKSIKNIVKGLGSYAVVLSAILAINNPFIINAATASSSATTMFEADTTSVAPVDPINPDLPGGGGGTGMEGPLSIDFLPNFDFGTNKITSKVETYFTSNTKPYVQITDKRGTGSGWQLNASLSQFKDTETGLQVLNGARIEFTNGEIITTSTNTSSAPTLSTPLTLPADGTKKTVTTAAANQGMGTWISRWLASDINGTSNENVKLIVDTANAKAATYSATIDWELVDTP